MTPEQVLNWRTVLVGMIGPYAFIMSEEEIYKFRDVFQAKVDLLKEESDE